MARPAMTPQEGMKEAVKRIVLAKSSRTRSLTLDNLELTEVPPGIGALANLQTLRLSGNQLTSFPQEIGSLTQLETLSISHNRLTSIPPEIAALTKLTLLFLSGNQLTSLPPQIASLTKLSSLYLSGNQLTSIPPEIAALTQLEELDLTDNQLTSLPPEIAALAQLQVLELAYNQLASLPPEIAALGRLRRLAFNDNPLPKELITLSSKGPRGVRSYFAGLKKSRGEPRTFDEAKLLFIGPGEVGKTFLLQALQGRKPESRGSTKGIEILREPLTLPHPVSNAKKRRPIRFNCWDFGGQDHYQITHQIFFSSKAIYLLVWKPRPGIDPGLETRLERIRLSSEKGARVFIVSTHADENVPPILNEQALRDKFSDLIVGFHAVDSKKGPDGTGIKKLQKAIAEAAAGLDGMDTPFPAHWVEAQEKLRAVDKPFLSFKEFGQECDKLNLTGEEACQLAEIMTVQGHATYFGDSDVPQEAKGENNLVILRPEWLAQAVAFVLEDKQTREGVSPGLLLHKRLKTVWRKDDHRGCPGYKAALHPFLLWLMWEFDIAYKQGDASSLVPELIQRNEPKDLLWTPTRPQQPPNGVLQTTLVCSVNQDVPLGMVPVLTAATYPLRSRTTADGDSLDRNWRTGFFIHTQYRGEAFVDLDEQARHLRMTVRAPYPASLTELIRKTLSTTINDRWPNLKHDLAIPCPQLKNNKPCPGLFDLAFLQERENESVPCQKCNQETPASALLFGLDLRGEEARRLHAETHQNQRHILAVALKLYRDMLDPMREEILRAPSMLSIIPEEAAWTDMLKRATETRVRVQCWCEHPDGPHRDIPPGHRKTVEHVLKGSKEWVSSAAPYIRWMSGIAKATIPVVGGAAGQAAEGIFREGTVKQIELMEKLAAAVQTEALEMPLQMRGRMLESTHPEIDSLRAIHDLMEEQWPKDKQWGGLRPVTIKTGQTLWLCVEHAALQSPPVLESLT